MESIRNSVRVDCDGSALIPIDGPHDIVTTMGVECLTRGRDYVFEGPNAVDILSKLFDDGKAGAMNVGYRQYQQLLSEHAGSFPPVCNFLFDHPDAVAPTKKRASDEGYDLTVIEMVKVRSQLTRVYDTGIIVEPPPGYYTEIVARSSLTKFGLVVSNGVGIIDSNYRGHLLISLTKIDPELPEPELPFRCAQLLLKKSTHFVWAHAPNLCATERGEGGFGSSG